MTKLLSMSGMTKEYPGVVANKDVSFDIDKAETHALLGENGAGKSTLVKMMYGLVRPTRGTMMWEGDKYIPENPFEARARGLGMVFQHFSLFDQMTVAENVELGLDASVKRKTLSEDIERVSESYGLPLRSKAVVGDLSAGERQRVEIVRALLQNPKLLIMDEPTSVLTPGEVEALFKALEKLKANNVSVLYISHKLDEVREICDNATVLRKGEVVARTDPRQETHQSLAKMMVGTDLTVVRKEPSSYDETVFSMDNVNYYAHSDLETSLHNVSIDVKAGEVLGIAGVAGNGQDELFGVLSGELIADTGEIVFADKNITKLSIGKRRALDMRFSPEERLGHAAVPSMNLIENMALSGSDVFEKKGTIDWRKVQETAVSVIKMFNVATADEKSLASSLSGGNLQKFVVGREIYHRPKFYVVNQPSWGVDVSAAEFIRQEIIRLANETGAAIIVISQDLNELFEVSDRIAVLSEGHLSDALSREEASFEKIGILMGGAINSETQSSEVRA